MYIRIGIGCLLLLCALSTQARIYKWVDAAGLVHFSDHPAANAQELHLDEQPSSTVANIAIQAGASVSTYTSLEVLQPQDNQTIPTERGEVAISLMLQPPGLQPGHEIRFMVDGGVVGHSTNTQIALSPIQEGTHKLYAAVVDAAGNVQITSKTVAFNVRKTPPQAPTPKP